MKPETIIGKYIFLHAPPLVADVAYTPILVTTLQIADNAAAAIINGSYVISFEQLNEYAKAARALRTQIEIKEY